MANRNMLVLLFLTLAMISLPVNAGEGYSGFLDSYPELKADADRPGASLYESPGFKRSAYNKVMFEPIVIFMHPKSDYKGLDASQLTSLSVGFIDALTEELEPDIPVVGQAGEGVLVVRIAITDLRIKKEKRGLFSYTPVGFVVNAAQQSAGRNIELKDAGIEIEMLDGATGKRLAVLVDRLALADEKGKVKHSWSGIEKTLRFYAKRFKQKIALRE